MNNFKYANYIMNEQLLVYWLVREKGNVIENS